MTTMTLGSDGEVTLPSEVQTRYGLAPATTVRLIETRSGLLLVPLTGAPMSAELKAELEDWQSLGLSAWEQFPYEESE